MEIKNVIICGLGALGLTYANKLKDVCNLKILADSNRIEKYKKNIPTLNGCNLELDYITPDEKWECDLIIIAVKSLGLDSAIEYIKNFVGKNTIIISLVNGISSEDKISTFYPKAKVLRSYFIGHSAMRQGQNVLQDGVGKIVLEKNFVIETFFKKNNIDYENFEDILYSQWLKLGVNIVLNQLTAIYECTVGDLRKRKDYRNIAISLLTEVKEIAHACGINNLDNYELQVLDSAKLVADDGKTSMYQDMVAKRKTEVDIFSGEIIKLGKIYGILTPWNEKIYSLIKEKEFRYFQ